MATKEESDEIALNQLSDADAKDFNTHLKESLSTDLSDLERTGCVSTGRDLKNQHVIVLVTHLGLIHGEKPEVSFRRMLLLFIRKANQIVGSPYSVVYAHTGFDIMNQYPLIYKFYSILPRPYKKNLLGMHVVHPNMGIRMFFEFARVFLSHKFYNKLCLYETILDFQRFIPPTQLQLPHKFLRKEDEDRDIKYCGHMAPLRRQFDKRIGTSKVLHICATYLREKGAFQQRGLFRVAGDEGELSLIKVRLQYAHRGTDRRERIHLSENNGYIIVGDVDLLAKPSSAQVIGSGDSNQTAAHTSKQHKKDKSAAGDNSKPSSNSSSSKYATEKRSGTSSSGDVSGVKAGGGSGSGAATAGPGGEKGEKQLPEELPNSLVIVTNTNTVAQVFKMAISHLPDPIVPSNVYTDVINLTRKYEPTGFSSDWERRIAASMSELPFPNLSTLVYLIRFLREVAAESALNSMDSTNLAIIFAPNVLRSDLIDPMKAVMEMRLSKIIVKELIDRRHILQQAMHISTDRRTSARLNSTGSSGSSSSSSSSGHSFIASTDSAAGAKNDAFYNTSNTNNTNNSNSKGETGAGGNTGDDYYADCTNQDNGIEDDEDYSDSKYIFENPINQEYRSESLLGDDLSAKMNAEDVREITDGFAPKFMARLNIMDAGSGRGSRSKSSNAVDKETAETAEEEEEEEEGAEEGEEEEGAADMSIAAVAKGTGVESELVDNKGVDMISEHIKREV